MADDEYDQRKSGGWHKRRHKKDGHTYRKNTSVVDMRDAKALRRNIFRPIHQDETATVKTTNNPNHEPSVHAELEKSLQRLAVLDFADQEHPVRRSQGMYYPKLRFGTFGHYETRNDNKHGPKAELQQDKSRLRSDGRTLKRWGYNPDTGLKAHLNEGPDPLAFEAEDEE